MVEEMKNATEGRSLPFLPFAVQLQNVFTAEITAKHFPVDISTFNFSDVQVGFNLDEIDVS